jgi:FixJ family two-component response regulator
VLSAQLTSLENSLRECSDAIDESAVRIENGREANRERGVLGFVVSGLLNKQIASEIGASEATVKIHRGNLMQKMQAGSLIELVRIADKLKLALAK